MKITIIGSGAWEGIPSPFCSCRICTAAENPTSKNYRTRPQFLIENQGGSFLLEVSPDIRLQSTRFHIPPITDFLISHWHFDHMYGLHELLSWAKKRPTPPTIYCSPQTADVITKEFHYLPLQVHLLQPFEQFLLFGVKITALPVYHMFGRDKDIPEKSLQNTFGFLFESDHSRAVYLSDYYHISSSTLKKVYGADIVIADGTYLSTDDFMHIKPNHMHGKDIVRFTSSLGAQTVYYHSISHLTRQTHEELQQSLPPHHVITYDGMRLL